MESTKDVSLDFKQYRKFRRILGHIILFAACIYLGFKNYLVYHTIVELHRIIIGFLILTISINTYKVNNDSKTIFLGIALGFVTYLDLMHMLMYKGMGIFGDDSANIPIQLYIAARYIESSSFFIYFILLNKKLNITKIIYIYISILVLLLISIFYLNVFPTCYVIDSGLTSFKIISEYIICGILGLSILFFIRKSHKNLNKSNLFIIYSLIFAITSEMLFIYNISEYDLSNILEHIFKLFSYYFAYIALVQSSLQEPQFELVELNHLLDNKNQSLEKLIYHLKLECEERRRGEAEILRKTELLGAILEASLNGILVISNDKEILHANNLLMKMWNIPCEIGSSRNCNKLIRAARSQVISSVEFDDFIKNILDEQDGYTRDLHLKDGKVIEISSLPFVDKGMAIGKVISFRDITEKNKIIELQKQVEIKQISLEKAKEFDELKTNFFSTVSHEFRTPINIILGVIQLLPHMSSKNQEDLDDLIPNKYIAMIKQNCYRLIKLANNLIDITKIDSGFMKMKFKNYNIVSIIEDITLSVVEHSNSKGISLIFDTEIEEIIMACDADNLERIMLNLLSNAVKFIEPGGKIEVNIKKKEEFAIISVKDNGIGIPKDMSVIIFDRFKQVDSTLRRQKEGSGIGLSIVKAMVEMHGGTILLDSEVGKGSEFIIQLPICIVDENHTNDLECTSNEVKVDKLNVDKINIEFSDIYELNHIY